MRAVDGHQAVRAAGLIFVSGTGPNDPQTGALVGSTIQEQTRQCLKNISAILRAADVVKVEVKQKLGELLSAAP